MSDCRGAAVIPLDVGLFATSYLGVALVSLKNPLLPHADVFFDLKRQHIRVPPRDRVRAYARLVETRPNASTRRGHALRPPVDYAVLTKTWCPWNGFGLAFGFVGRP